MSDIANDVLQQNEEQQENNNVDINLLNQPANNIDDNVDQAAPIETTQDLDDTVEGMSSMAVAHSSLLNAMGQLSNSKVVHFGMTFKDSDNMIEVKNAITELIAGLDAAIPTQEDEYLENVEYISSLYTELINACQNYLGDIKERNRGKSKSGKNRLKLTTRVLELSQSELGYFQVSADEYYAEHGQEGNAWKDVINRVRSTDLRESLKNNEIVSDSNSNSPVYKRTVNGKTTIIKPAERLSMSDSLNDTLEAYLKSGAPNAEETVAWFRLGAKAADSALKDVWTLVKEALEEHPDKREELGAEEYKKFITKLRNDKLSSALDILSRDEKAASYIKANLEVMKNFLIYVHKKSDEFSVATKDAGIAPGAAISNRNVSTSRIAESLGVEDVVTKSETVLMKAKDGSTLVGTATEAAGESTVQDCARLAKSQNLTIKYTANALKQSWELQVLDLVCGQINRDVKSCSATYKVEDGIMFITSIKGFDNDMSFGVKTLKEMNKGANANALVQDGKISIPFLPKEFFNKIKSYASNPGQIEYEQLDIRSKEEIGSLQRRLLEVRSKLEQLEKSGQLKLLDTEEQWEEAVKQYYANPDQYARNNYVTGINPDLLNQPIHNIEGNVDQAMPIDANQENDDKIDIGAATAYAHSKLLDSMNQLLASKVVHLGITYSDSANMTTVKRAITSLNNEMGNDIPKEQSEFRSALKNISTLYSDLIKACDTYLEDIKGRNRGKSKSGQTRFKLTTQVLEQAQKEYDIFLASANEYFDNHGKEGNKWTDILYRVRAKDLRGQLNNSDIVSGSISNVYKRTVKGKTTYIKPEERLPMSDSLDGLIEAYLKSGAPKAQETVTMYKRGAKAAGNDIVNVWKRLKEAFADHTEKRATMGVENYTKYITELRNNKLNSALAILCDDDEVASYIRANEDLVKNFLIYIQKKAGEFSVATENAGIAPGSTISNRNVSTTRVAQRLGVEDVVATSETILMKDDNGSTIVANEMESAGELTVYDCRQLAKSKNLTIRYTANALKQSWELQVLDLICGQIDRHVNNYSATYEVDNGVMYITSIKGFDNDMSFGVKTLKDMNKSSKVDAIFSGGKISVPFLPRDFYEKIMAYTPEMVAFDQLDIRSKEEIQSLQDRLNEIKKQLMRLERSGLLTLLDTEDEWAQAVETYYSKENRDKYARSYVLLPK